MLPISPLVLVAPTWTLAMSGSRLTISSPVFTASACKSWARVPAGKSIVADRGARAWPWVGHSSKAMTRLASAARRRQYPFFAVTLYFGPYQCRQMRCILRSVSCQVDVAGKRLFGQGRSDFYPGARPAIDCRRDIGQTISAKFQLAFLPLADVRRPGARHCSPRFIDGDGLAGADVHIGAVGVENNAPFG